MALFSGLVVLHAAQPPAAAEASPPPDALQAAESLPDAPSPDAQPSLDLIEPLELESLMAGIPVSLRQLVQTLIANNLGIRIERYAPELGQAAVRSAWGAFDPEFGFKLSYDYSQVPQNAQEYVATGGQTSQTQQALLGQLVGLQDSLDTLIAQLQGQPPPTSKNEIKPYSDPRTFTTENLGLTYSLGGRLPLGTTYEFQLRQLQLKNDINSEIPPSLFFPEYSTFAGVILKQPLLRDFGPAAGMAGVRLARLQRSDGWLIWRQKMIASTARLSAAYFDLVFAVENVRFKQEISRGAAKIQWNNARKGSFGRISPSDVYQASGAVARANDDTLTAIREMIRIQGELSTLVQGETSSPGLIRFLPSDSLSIPHISMDRNAFIGEAFRNRPEYLTAQNEVEKTGIRVRYFRNQALPRLDVESTLGVYGLEGSFGSSLANASEGQGTAFSVALVASVPLGNIKGRADLDTAKYQRMQAVLRLKEQEVNLSVDLDVALTTINIAKLKLDAAREASRKAAESLHSEQQRLLEGLSDTFTVISLQNEFSNSKTRELASQAELRKAYLQLSIARGSLLEEFGVPLKREALAQTPKGVNPRRTPQGEALGN